MRALAFAVLACALVPACEDGPYAAPPGQFYCGSDTCSIDSQICVVVPETDAGGTRTTCGFPPEACNGAPACPCALSGCQGTCQTGGDGSVTVTCSTY